MKFDRLCNNLNWLMAEARLNSNELARRTGIPASSIKKIRNNDNPNPTLTTLAPLANFFSITISELIGDEALDINNITQAKIKNNNAHQIPIISWEDAANWPMKSNQNYSLLLTERPCRQHTFALIVEETSYPFFPKKTILIIDPDAPIQHDDYVLTIKNDHTKPMLKQVVIEEDIFLKSLLIENHLVQKNNDYKFLGVILEQRFNFR